MKKLFIAALLLSVSTTAYAATKTPSSIAKTILNDAIAAQNMSGPAASPIDPTGYACYSGIVTDLNGLNQASPAGIISTGEAAWLVALTVQKVAADSNCQQVCGRVQLLASKVAGPIAGLVMPNICGTFQSLAE